MQQDKDNYGLIRQRTGIAALQPIPIPELELESDYVLVRTVTVALNPTDWTTLDAAGAPDTLVGCDFAGVVEDVGSAMGVKERFKRGDRVAGFAHGGNDAKPYTGAFARYIVAKAALVVHVPDDVSFETACTVGVGFGTAGYALYKVLGLPFPTSVVDEDDDARGRRRSEAEGGETEGKGKTLLVYGGSTATGTIAIQLAKLSGWNVITTCSARNFDLVKDRGADMVFDYRAEGVGNQIREASRNSITNIFDTVNTPETAQICAAAFADPNSNSDSNSSSGSSQPTSEKKYIYCNLLGEPCPRKDVESVFFLGYSLSGESYIFEAEDYPAQPEDLDFAEKWMPLVEKLWAQGKVKTHPERVGGKGLLGCLEGMDEMRQGKVSGVKLVYRVEDTPWPSS